MLSVTKLSSQMSHSIWIKIILHKKCKIVFHILPGESNTFAAIFIVQIQNSFKMSSDQQKKQLLAQKLLRSVKNKQKSSKLNEKQDSSKKSSHGKNSSSDRVNEADLTK